MCHGGVEADGGGGGDAAPPLPILGPWWWAAARSSVEEGTDLFSDVVLEWMGVRAATWQVFRFLPSVAKPLCVRERDQSAELDSAHCTCSLVKEMHSLC